MDINKINKMVIGNLSLYRFSNNQKYLLSFGIDEQCEENYHLVLKKL